MTVVVMMKVLVVVVIVEVVNMDITAHGSSLPKMRKRIPILRILQANKRRERLDVDASFKVAAGGS
jgi:hypothetical protein